MAQGAPLLAGVARSGDFYINDPVSCRDGRIRPSRDAKGERLHLNRKCRRIKNEYQAPDGSNLGRIVRKPEARSRK